MHLSMYISRVCDFTCASLASCQSSPLFEETPQFTLVLCVSACVGGRVRVWASVCVHVRVCMPVPRSWSFTDLNLAQRNVLSMCPSRPGCCDGTSGNTDARRNAQAAGTPPGCVVAAPRPVTTPGGPVLCPQCYKGQWLCCWCPHA